MCLSNICDDDKTIIYRMRLCRKHLFSFIVQLIHWRVNSFYKKTCIILNNEVIIGSHNRKSFSGDSFQNFLFLLCLLNI